MSDAWSPLYLLIHKRLNELGLSMGTLAIRCGCNPAKGARWINAIADGHVSHSRAQEIAQRLPAALGVSAVEVETALAQTITQNEEKRSVEKAKQDAQWRASFKPHAYFDTESKIPSQITMFLLSGGPDAYLKINLDLKQPPITYAGQAAKIVRDTICVRFFGNPIGFIVNYSPDCAIRFDLEGTPLEVSERAYEPGSGSIEFGGRQIDSARFARLVGQINA